MNKSVVVTEVNNGFVISGSLDSEEKVFIADSLDDMKGALDSFFLNEDT